VYYNSFYQLCKPEAGRRKWAGKSVDRGNIMNTFDSAIFLENIEWFDETGQELVQE